LPHLRTLDLTGTRLSAKRFAELKAALRGAQLSWWEPNRTAAEDVLALGGTVDIRAAGAAGEKRLKTAADLPSTYFRVSRVSLRGVKKPLGDLVIKLGALTDPDFDALHSLDLANSALGDNDLQALAALKTLTELSLASTRVNDAGLASLKGLKQLRRLDLDGTAFRGAGLVYLKELTNLAELRLGCATLTDLFARQFSKLQGLKRLERLSLAGSRIGDDTLKQLHALTWLRELDLSGTRVSAASVAALRKALPQCRILAAPE
jgi:hypothetical protein